LLANFSFLTVPSLLVVLVVVTAEVVVVTTVVVVVAVVVVVVAAAVLVEVVVVVVVTGKAHAWRIANSLVPVLSQSQITTLSPELSTETHLSW